MLDAGEYSWEINAEACYPCPLGAFCAGGDDMKPEPGFWRRDNETETLYRCPIPDACTPDGCADGCVVQYQLDCWCRDERRPVTLVYVASGWLPTLQVCRRTV